MGKINSLFIIALIIGSIPWACLMFPVIEHYNWAWNKFPYPERNYKLIDILLIIQQILLYIQICVMIYVIINLIIMIIFK